MDFKDFRKRIRRDIDQHQVIANNKYTKWFKLGDVMPADVVDLVEQFSVFSNHFLTIQCMRMVNASNEEAEEAARDILANEIGVGIDIESGSTEGKIFSHKRAHIRWLRDMGEMLFLDRCSLGRWDMGTNFTHEFLNRLRDVYASSNANVSAGASFAIEYWAGYGLGTENEHNNFWRELVNGLEAFNKNWRLPNGLPMLDTSFFKFHSELERAHVANVEHELQEAFTESDFNESNWFNGATNALDAINIFWMGLNTDRNSRRRK